MSSGAANLIALFAFLLHHETEQHSGTDVSPSTHQKRHTQRPAAGGLGG